MNTTGKTHKLALGAVIAALYVVLTFMQETLLPGTASMAVQFRISEALTVLALFTPSAIPGLTVGCIVANLITLGALPLDVLLGSFATLLAVASMYKLRKITFRDLPLLSFLMPAAFNGIIIGLEIEMFYIEGQFHFTSFLIQAGAVALGEIVVLYTLGLLLYKVIKNKKLEKYLF